MEKEVNFEKNTFSKRLGSMLNVDFRRMFKTPLVYFMIATALVIPILILVMTSMMDGSVSVDPQTGVETVFHGFDNVWQIIGTVSSGGAASTETAGAGIDMLAMCNINLLYFLMSILVCAFVASEFKSGYVKNLFTSRAKKTDYVVSKTIVCFVGGALMILAFFIGTMLGGAIAGVSFKMEGFHAGNVVMCILSKMLMVSVFVPIYLVMSIVAKQRLWLSLILSFMVGMFLFMMIPMVTPLDANLLHAGLCVAGGALFGIGLGAISNLVLKKTSLV